MTDTTISSPPTISPAVSPVPATHLRLPLTISSPEIMTRIQRAFASKGLQVWIETPPTVEVVVGPGPGPGAGAGAIADVLYRLTRAGDQDSGVQVARYRLSLSRSRGSGRSLPAVPAPAERAAEVPVGSPGAQVVPLPAPARSGDPEQPGPWAVRPAGTALSVREAEVMVWLARGARNREIAQAMGLAPKTVKNHVNRIFAKLGAHTRVEAVLRWQQRDGAGRDLAPGGHGPRTPATDVPVADVSVADVPGADV